jgi:Sap, sulfolipid-1-addressing protein
MGSLLGPLIPAALVAALAPLPITIVVTSLVSKGGVAKALGFAGALVAVFAVIGVITLTTSSAAGSTSSKGSAVTGTILAVLGVLFLLIAVKQLLNAPDPDAAPPKFMTALDTMSVARATVFGAILALINVKQLGIYVGGLAQIVHADVSSAARWVAFVILLVVVQIGARRPDRGEPFCAARHRGSCLPFRFVAHIVHDMNDSSTNDLVRRRPTQGGPPMGVLAAVSLALLLAGLITSAALGGTIPSPFGSAASIQHYFLAHPSAVKASGILAFASSVPLAIYAATASARLRQLGVTAPGATIALAGGLLSASALSLSGLLQWTLSRPAVRGDTALVRAFDDLSFLTGGPAHVVALGLLLAGIAVPSLILGLLPRPLAWAGLVIAGLAELSTIVLIWPSLAVLLPIARFPGLIWLIVAGFLLPHRRPGRDHADRPRHPLGTDA